ncbi:hypothetical protein ACOME3_008895 [Neoechinorhynchus agilis]
MFNLDKTMQSNYTGTSIIRNVNFIRIYFCQRHELYKCSIWTKQCNQTTLGRRLSETSILSGYIFVNDVNFINVQSGQNDAIKLHWDVDYLKRQFYPDIFLSTT